MLIQAPRGPKDVLPADSYRWQYLENRMRNAAALALVGRGGAGGPGLRRHRRDPLPGPGPGAGGLPDPGKGRFGARGDPALRGPGQRGHADERVRHMYTIYGGRGQRFRHI